MSITDVAIVVGADPIDTSKEFTILGAEGPIPPPPPGYCNLIGRITGFLGRPVGDAVVAINSKQTKTDTVGGYTFLELPLGTYTMKVVKEPWYNSVEVELSLTESTIYTKDIGLGVKPAVLYGVPLAIVTGVGAGAYAAKTRRNKK